MENRRKKQAVNEYRQLDLLDGIELLHAQDCTIHFPLHQHATFNISLILKNTFQTDLLDRSFLAPKASIAITNPKELHATPCEPTIGNSFFTFYIPPTVIEHLCGNDEQLFAKDRVIGDPQIFSEFLWLSQKTSTDEPYYEDRFLKNLKALIRIAQTSPSEQHPDNSIRQFIQGILSNSEDFSLDSIASKYGINKYKFIRLFKQEIGLTPKQYLLHKRIEKSKALLREGCPIFDVAIDCGFYDGPHFYKYFKQYIGVNPLEFQAAFQD